MNPTSSRPSTVSLKIAGEQRYEEAKVATAFYPGMLVKQNSSGYLLAQATAGQKCAVKIATEDVIALRGKTMLDQYAADEVASWKHLKSGDEFLGFLADEASVTALGLCMATGDGSFTPYVDDTEAVDGNAGTVTVRPNHALVEALETLDNTGAAGMQLCTFRVL